jgi:hypothetical protein
MHLELSRPMPDSFTPPTHDQYVPGYEPPSIRKFCPVT